MILFMTTDAADVMQLFLPLDYSEPVDVKAAIIVIAFNPETEQRITLLYDITLSQFIRPDTLPLPMQMTVHIPPEYSGEVFYSADLDVPVVCRTQNSCEEDHAGNHEANYDTFAAVTTIYREPEMLPYVMTIKVECSEMCDDDGITVPSMHAFTKLESLFGAE